MRRLTSAVDADIQAALVYAHSKADEKKYSTSFVRRSMQQMDYVFRFALTSTTQKQDQRIQTESGYLFLCTGVSCIFDLDATNPPLVGVYDALRGREPIGSTTNTDSYLSAFGGYGAGPKLASVASEPRELVWMFGDRGTIGVRAIQNPNDTAASRFVEVLVTGWKINLHTR
jgi:hypothetical protein